MLLHFFFLFYSSLFSCLLFNMANWHLLSLKYDFTQSALMIHILDTLKYVVPDYVGPTVKC